MRHLSILAVALALAATVQAADITAARQTAASKQARAAPFTPQAMPKRASSRHESGPRNPLTLGSIFSAGMRHSSKCSSEVTLARSESLW